VDCGPPVARAAEVEDDEDDDVDEDAEEKKGDEATDEPKRRAPLAYADPSDPLDSVRRQLLDPELVGHILTPEELHSGPAWYTRVLYSFMSHQVAWVSQRHDPHALHLVHPGVFLHLRDGRVAWILGVSSEELCRAVPRTRVPVMTGTATFQWWTQLERDTAATEAQHLAPFCTAHVRLWDSRDAFQHRPSAFTELRGDQELPLDDLDGAVVLRVRVHRAGRPSVDNAPFYARPDSQPWGDAPDVFPPVDVAPLDWFPGSAVDGVPEWLVTGRDPWLTAAAEIAAAEGRRLVLWPVNWSVDDTKIRSFADFMGRQMRLGYHWTDAVRVRALSPLHSWHPSPSSPFPALARTRRPLGIQARLLRMHPFTASPKWAGEVPVGAAMSALFPHVVRLARADMRMPLAEAMPFLADIDVNTVAASPTSAAQHGIGKALVLLFPGRVLTDSPQQVDATGRRKSFPWMNDRHTLDHRAELPRLDDVPRLHHSRLYRQSLVLAVRRMVKSWDGDAGFKTATRAALKVLGVDRRDPPYGNLPTDLLALTELLHMRDLGFGLMSNKAQMQLLRAVEGKDTMPLVQQLVRHMPRLPYTGSMRNVVWTALRLAGARKGRTMVNVHRQLHKAADLLLAGGVPAELTAARERTLVMREAILLVDKAMFARTASEFRQLRDLARELAPRLFQAWDGHGMQANNMKAWRNLFEVDLVVLQDAHALMGGAVDTFHQMYKRGACMLFWGKPGKRPWCAAAFKLSNHRMDACEELLAKVLMMDNMCHWLSGGLCLNRTHRSKALVPAAVWTLRHHAPVRTHTGGLPPPRVVVRVYRGAHSC